MRPKISTIAAAGSARVALLNEDAKPLPGFDIADCDPISGDFVEQVVTWRDNFNVSTHTAEVVRLKFEMQDAKLYALQFAGPPLSPSDLNADGAVNHLDFALLVQNWPE